MSVFDTIGRKVADAGEAATDTARGLARDAVLARIPGRGAIWDHDGDRFAIVGAGALILGAAAIYGAIRFLGR